MSLTRLLLVNRQEERESGWRKQCGTIEDTSCSRCGISASVLRYLWVMPEAHWCHHCLSIAVDYATVTSVFCIEGPGDLPYISMTMSQTLQTRYKVTWTSAFGAAAHTFRIKTQQGGMYLPIISYVWEDPKDRNISKTHTVFMWLMLSIFSSIL
ncbi:hypothetical protein GOODEAATRI_025355 [Goodea atripinnis]|uniref:Uncharacterized protein n=1 Tax=Goodea atripinnis TaxID=208336 RepID=A0ABV0MV27_9TELE